jgi:thioredoxin reductase
MSPPADVDVLIAGGGTVALTAALELARREYQPAEAHAAAFVVRPDGYLGFVDRAAIDVEALVTHSKTTFA